MAVITAKWIDIAVDNKNKLITIFNRTQTFVVILLWLMISLLVFYLFPLPKLYFMIIAVAGIGLSLFVILKIKDSLTKLLAPSLIAFACLMLILNTHVFPYIFSYQAPPKAARYFTENAGDSNKLYNYKYGQYELFFYSEPQATQLKTIADLKNAAETKGSWIFTDPEGLKDFEALQLEPDTVIEYRHLYLNRGGRFINPKTRDKVLQPMYLIKLPN
jgi:hypothetical protein